MKKEEILKFFVLAAPMAFTMYLCGQMVNYMHEINTALEKKDAKLNSVIEKIENTPTNVINITSQPNSITVLASTPNSVTINYDTEVGNSEELKAENTLYNKIVLNTAIDKLDKSMYGENFSLENSKEKEFKDLELKPIIIKHPREYVGLYYNLKVQTHLDENDMNKIIDYWDSHIQGGTTFKGKGALFIEASRQSGLDPVYILSHAAWESKWGKSELAINKANYFGIAAYDFNPYSSAYVMGTSMESGIINGAIWIKRNYYDNGYTNLNSMIQYGNYASDQNWPEGISNIMRISYDIL